MDNVSTLLLWSKFVPASVSLYREFGQTLDCLCIDNSAIKSHISKRILKIPCLLINDLSGEQLLYGYSAIKNKLMPVTLEEFENHEEPVRSQQPVHRTPIEKNAPESEDEQDITEQFQDQIQRPSEEDEPENSEDEKSDEEEDDYSQDVDRGKTKGIVRPSAKEVADRKRLAAERVREFQRGTGPLRDKKNAKSAKDIVKKAMNERRELDNRNERKR